MENFYSQKSNEINGLFFEKKTEMILALILVMFNLLFKITAAPFNF
jgi:NADH:ubiquinone oxidoreductase subunit 2 (subunit N)